MSFQELLIIHSQGIILFPRCLVLSVEAVPTAFLFSVLVISGLGAEDGKLNGLWHLLVGSWESNWVDIDQFILFCISCGSSVFSAVFGVSR